MTISDRKGLLSKLWRPDLDLCSAVDPGAAERLNTLNQSMSEFYNGLFVEMYFAAAEHSNERWTEKLRGHWHLKNAIQQGSSVIDLGCGTGHPYRNFGNRAIRYTGVDWSESQIEENRKKMPCQTFIAASLYDVPLSAGTFDAAISLYVIEHMVWPHRLLDEMYRLVRPGGLVGVLCPPYRTSSSIKSISYGLKSRPFMKKVSSGSFVDAAVHLFQHRVTVPRYIDSHFPRGSAEGRFLINLKPLCLRGTWFPDADAVYFTDTAEMAAHLKQKGGQVIEEWPEYAYLLFRKE